VGEKKTEKLRRRPSWKKNGDNATHTKYQPGVRKAKQKKNKWLREEAKKKKKRAKKKRKKKKKVWGQNCEAQGATLGEKGGQTERD